MSKLYTIGQILYIISPKTQTVIPVQVQEINQKTTIEGEKISFLVRDPEGKSLYNLDEIDGQVFTNPSDVAKTLKENVNKSIDQMISSACELAKKKFDSSSFEPENHIMVKTKPVPPPLPIPQIQELKSNEKIAEVEVIGNDGKIHLQKQKIRIHPSSLTVS